MAEDGSTRRELVRRMLTLGPLAALAGALGTNRPGGVKPAYATSIPDDLIVAGTLTVNGTGNSSIAGTGAFASQTMSIGGASGLPGERAYLAYNGYVTRARLTGVSGVSLGLGTNGTDDRLIIDGGGNVGIGRTSSGYRLEVAGTLLVAGGIGPLQAYGSGLDGSTYQKLVLFVDTANGVYFDAPLDAAGNRLDVEFNWRGGGSPALFLRGSNRFVGIGTRTPVYALDVVGDVHLTGLLDADCISIGGASGLPGERAYLLYNPYATRARLTSVSGVSLGLGTNGIDDRLIIDGGGSVGIGVPSPGATLHVNGWALVERNSPSDYASFRGKADQPYGWELDVFGSSYGSNSYGAGPNGVALVAANYAKLVLGTFNQGRVFIDGDGKMGIGAPVPSAQLDVAGTIRATGSILLPYGVLEGNARRSYYDT